MCQIQVIKRLDKKNLSKEEIEGFLNLMYYGNEKNNDAFGIFSDKGTIIKEVGSMDYGKTWENIEKIKTNFLVGHNRYKTKGDAKVIENNHPFETKNFVVVHNGVISNDETIKKDYNLDYSVTTDSYIISALLEHFLSSNLDYLTAIKLTAEELYGSFSVMIYYKPTKQLFYFKDYSTNFTFSLINIDDWKVLVGSTDRTNINKSFSKTIFQFFSLPIEHAVYSPVNEKIYEITDKGLSVVGDFDEKKYCGYFGDTAYSGYTTKEKKEENRSSVRNSIKSIFKLIASDAITRLKTSHDIRIINREYKYNSSELILECKQEISSKTAIYIEEEFVDLGNVEVENIFIDNKYVKTKIIIYLEKDTINDLIWHSDAMTDTETKMVKALFGG
jgi:hypothetical protein